MVTWYIEGFADKSQNKVRAILGAHPFAVGRRSTCDLTLRSKMVSSNHAEIVHRDAKTQSPKLCDSSPHLIDVRERGTLGHFQHDPRGHEGQRRLGIAKRRVEHVPWVKIDEEQQAVGEVACRSRGSLANDLAEARQLIQTFGRVEYLRRSGQGGFLAAQKRFITEYASIRQSHDGLERHPERGQGTVQAGLEPGSIGGDVSATNQLERFAFGLGELV